MEDCVEIAGTLRKDGLRTPRMGAVSNSANGVLTMVLCCARCHPQILGDRELECISRGESPVLEKRKETGLVGR